MKDLHKRQKSEMKADQRYQHTLEACHEMFGTDWIPIVQIFDAFYDFFEIPLNTRMFVKYAEADLLGSWNIETSEDGLQYRITKIF